MRYFAYGTNMNPEVMERKGLDFTRRERAVLPDHALVFDKASERELLPAEIGFANVAPAAGESVEGVLYELPDAARGRLDELERAPEHYERVTVEVRTDAGPRVCETYRANPAKTRAGLVPSRSYLNHILAARDCLSPAYRARLEGLTAYAGECAACGQAAVVVFQKEEGRMFTLCLPCAESRRVWSDGMARRLTVAETAAVVRHLQESGEGYPSIPALLEDAVRRGLLAPPSAR